MPEQNGQEAQPKPPKPTVASLAAEVGSIKDGLRDLTNAVSGLVTAQRNAQAAPSPMAQPGTFVPSPGMAAPPGMQWEQGSGIVGGKQTFVDPSYKPEMLKVDPLPVDWIRVKDQILGPEFGIDAEQFSDRPFVQVHVIVPDKYSNVPPEQRPIKKWDRRSKVISTAAAVPELSEWMNRIRINLRETQSALGRVTPLNTVGNV